MVTVPHSGAMAIFAPNATETLGAAVAQALGCELAALEQRRFDGGEFKIRPLESVRASARAPRVRSPAPATSSASCCSSPAHRAMPAQKASVR
jgi:hypothetical protein